MGLQMPSMYFFKSKHIPIGIPTTTTIAITNATANTISTTIAFTTILMGYFKAHGAICFPLMDSYEGMVKKRLCRPFKCG